MKLIIDIPERLFEAYKGRPPRLGDEGMDMIAQAIANGTPVKTVTNVEEAEAYSINQEENCKIVREFLHNVANIKDLPISKNKLDYSRPQGKWIYHEDWENEGGCGYECSCCGRTYDYDMNFCGYCGAKMTKEAENEDSN